MNDNTKKFSGKSQVYAQSRPGYPAEFIEFLQVSAGINKEITVADIGSGTGKLSVELLKIGGKVFCVEPNKDMRSAAEEFLAGYENFVSIDAAAENTTLADNSINVITAAQAFHWFDVKAFKNECKHILKPGGKIVLVWNSRDENNAFVQENAEICKKFCPNFTGFSGGIHNEVSKIDIFFDGDYEKTEFRNDINFTKEKFIQRMQSASYSISADNANYKDYMSALEKLFDKYETDGVLTMPNVTRAYIGTV